MAAAQNRAFPGKQPRVLGWSVDGLCDASDATRGYSSCSRAIARSRPRVRVQDVGDRGRPYPCDAGVAEVRALGQRKHGMSKTTGRHPLGCYRQRHDPAKRMVSEHIYGVRIARWRRRQDAGGRDARTRPGSWAPKSTSAPFRKGREYGLHSSTRASGAGAGRELGNTIPAANALDQGALLERVGGYRLRRAAYAIRVRGHIGLGAFGYRSSIRQGLRGV